MNRDEAIKEAYKIVNMSNDDTLLKELIDKIYDDFKDKICVNCRYFGAFDTCNNIDSYAYDSCIDNLEFGCNQFAKKEQEQYI